MLYIIFSLSSDTFQYTAIFGRQLELTSSQLSVRVYVEILDDNVLEVLLKRFQANLVLSGPIMVTRADAITIAPNVANVTIRDDDGETVRQASLYHYHAVQVYRLLPIFTAVFFTFRDPEYTFGENIVTGVVYVDKEGATIKDFTVRVSGGM